VRPIRGHIPHAHARPPGRVDVSFDGAHIHDVRNGGASPATSIHVYSPPIRRMGHYSLAGGQMRREPVSYELAAAPAA
jgi:hypothetical protein